VAGRDLFSKKLYINALLASLAGFVTSFGAFLTATDKPADFAVYVSAAVAAGYGALRLFVGALAAAAGKTPTVDQ